MGSILMFAYVYVIYFDGVHPPFPYHVLLSTLASTSSQLAPSTFITLYFFLTQCVSLGLFTVARVPYY